MPKVELSVVLDEDLREMLRKMGFLERIEAQQIFCCRCGRTVTLRNLQFVLPLKVGEANFVCDIPECVDSSLSGNSSVSRS